MFLGHPEYSKGMRMAGRMGWRQGESNQNLIQTVFENQSLK